MIRTNNIFADKIPKLEHVFSSSKHLIFRSYQKGTLDTYLTKRIVVKDEKLLQYYKYHIYSNVLTYLAKQKGKKNMSTLMIGEQKGSIIVTAKEGEIASFDEQPVQDDGMALFISKLMIEGQSLRQMILRKDQRIDKEFCHDLVGTLVDFILGNGGISDLMLTSQNIIFEDCGYFHLNYFSLVGLQFWRMQKYITRAQMQEILPFLTVEMIGTQSSVRKIDLRMYLKFIMLNFFGAFFKKDLIFQSKYLDLDVQVKISDEKVLKTVQKIENVLLPKLLPPEMEQELKVFDRNFNVDYLEALKTALNVVSKEENCRKDEISWQYILNKLSKNTKDKDYEAKSDVSDDESGFETYPIMKNEYRFSMNFFEFLDLYISLVHLLKPILERQKETKQQKKSLAILKNAETLVNERNLFISQQRYSHSLFFPILTGMKFSQILNYKNWIDMLNSAVRTQVATFDALTKVINILIEVRETLCSIEPLITSKILQQAISQKKCQKDNINSSKSFYRYLQLLTQGFKPLTQELDSPIALQKNLKSEFWRLSFWFQNQLLMLVKRCFIKTTQHNLTSNIKIKRHPFSSIIMTIDPFTPPITQNDDLKKMIF